MRVKEIDKYANAQATMCTQYTTNNAVALDFSREREHEPSTSRTFVRLFALDYKGARQSRQRVRKNSIRLL